jgi:hypothetical protein
MEEQIYNVYWEGPFKWEERGQYLKLNHVLYALHGSHHLYGRDVLLYIGRTNAGIAGRLASHAKWVDDEYDAMTLRIAPVGRFTNGKDAYAVEEYPQAAPDVVRGIETLLIYAHQPAYNTMSKASLDYAKGFRILNTGRIGHLLPEVSYLYYQDSE